MSIFCTKGIKWVKQHDSMQCGVACLAMICHHYGRGYSLEYLDSLCHANKSGVSMLGIADGAACVGLETKTLAASTDEIMGIKLPCILHWNQNHFVVLYKISSNGRTFKIADPGKGLIKYNRKEFESHWIGLMTNSSRPRKPDLYSSLCPLPVHVCATSIQQSRRNVNGAAEHGNRVQ